MNSFEEGAANVRCSLLLKFSSSDRAEKVHGAVALDNEDYVESTVRGEAICAEMNASSLKSLLHTLDDFLACVSVAEKIVSKKD